MRIAFVVSIVVCGSAVAARADDPPVPLTCKASTECPSTATCSAAGLCVETAAAKPPVVAPPAVNLDAVVLKSGERIEGQVKEQARGQYVVIEAGGKVRTIMWDSIAEVVVTKESEDRLAKLAAPAAATPAPAVATTGRPLKVGNKKSKKKVVRISTTTAFNANKEGAGLFRTVKCSKDGDPTCKEQASLTVGREGPKAAYSSEVDCSKTPGSDSCTEKKAIGVSRAGFGASYTKEELVAVDEAKRPSHSANFGMTGLAGFGGNADVQIFITNFDLNLKLLTGGKFPKKTGGNWAGLALEPTVGFVLEAISVPDGFGGTTSLTGTGVRGGSSIGLQIMHFGQMNDKTLKQRGVGVFLGVFAGFQNVATHFMGMTMPGTTETSVGPQINLVFPNFNAGTAKYKSTSLNFMILPTGDFVFVSFGFATVF